MNDDLDIKVAMETAVSAADDLTTIASGDLIPIYRPNPTTGRDELVGKIPKNYFDQAVLSSMGVLLNGGGDQQTITKVPTLNGNTFGASTIATLASVLGVTKFHPVTDAQLAAITETCYGYYIDEPNGMFMNINFSPGIYEGYKMQIRGRDNGTELFYRHGTPYQMSAWREIALDIPSFYKNYGNINALATALGEEGLGVDIRSTHMASVDVGELKAISAEQGVYGVTTQPVDVCVFNNTQLLVYYEGGEPVVHVRMRRNGEWIEKIL